MLSKTTETNGLDADQINTVLDLYMNLIYSGNAEQYEETKNWLTKAAKNSYIKKIMINKFSTVTEPSKQEKIIEVAIETKDEDLIKNIVKNILNSSKQPQIRTTAEKIKKSLGSSNLELFKAVASEYLKEIKGDEIEQYKEYIEFYIGSSEILSGNEGLVIDKLKSALASDKKDRWMFAIDLLEKVDKIPDDKKGKVKELINDLNESTLSDIEKDRIKKIKNKLR